MERIVSCVKSSHPNAEMSADAATVSPPWLERKLLELWLQTHYGQVTITDCEARLATMKGDNYLSVMHRLVVRTRDEGSYPLIVKCRMEEGATARIMRDSSIFRKEQEMYVNTLPRMSALLKKALPGSFEPLSPKCIYACKSFLLLEDLCAAGFRMLDRLQGLDLDHCLQVMRALAKFHAASVVLHQQDPDSMKEYEVNFFSEPSLYNSWKNFFSGMTKTLVEEMETWPEEWHKYVKKLRGMQDNMVELLDKTTRRNEKGFNVLAHGDLWLNNVMFKRHSNSVRFVDFQLVNFTSPAIDLHLFICSSATLDVRMHHVDTLLQEYHTALCDTLTALDYTQPLITLQELYEEFDRKAMYGLWSVVCPVPCMLSHPNCGFEMDNVLERGVTPGPSMFTDNYKKVVKWMLPVLDRQGVFGENKYPDIKMSVASPPWLDKKLLEVWLRPHYGETKVTECETQAADGKGDNYLSTMHRVVVRTKSGGSHSLIIKCRLEDGAYASAMAETRIYRKEQAMYDSTLARMSAILEKALPADFEPLSPKCIQAYKGFLVLEDLSAVGFRMLDRLQGLDLDHCLLVMRALAKFHAASVVLHQQDPDSMKEYEVNFFSETSIKDKMKRFFKAMINTLVEEMETWPEEWARYVDKLKHEQEKLPDLMKETVRPNETGINVLAHGDLWINNILFDEQQGTVRFVDFQFVTFMSPAVDLHLFLCTSATPDVQVNHADTLLQEYHSTLCDTLTALGYTQTLITLAELHEEFDRKSTYGLLAIAVCSAFMMSDPDCGFNMEDAIERGLTPGPSMFSDRYKKAVKWMLPVLDRQGAFGDK